MDDKRLAKCVMVGEHVEGVISTERQKNELMGYPLDHLIQIDP